MWILVLCLAGLYCIERQIYFVFHNLFLFYFWARGCALSKGSVLGQCVHMLRREYDQLTALGLPLVEL